MLSNSYPASVTPLTACPIRPLAVLPYRLGPLRCDQADRAALPYRLDLCCDQADRATLPYRLDPYCDTPTEAAVVALAALARSSSSRGEPGLWPSVVSSWLYTACPTHLGADQGSMNAASAAAV